MKDEMKQWLKENNYFSDKAKKLFEDSFRCYDSEAYEGAFISSYLAFKVILRDRFLKIEDLFEYDEEEEIKNELEDDDKWEARINKLVQELFSMNTKKGKLLPIKSDKVIKGYGYWKDKRNACAHAKNETINSSTIEEFWNYLRDNLKIFYSIGGKKYQVNALLDIYKYFSIENSEEKLDSILQETKLVYPDLEGFFEEFIKELFKENEKLRGQIEVNKQNRNFWERILNCKDEKIKKGFVIALLKFELSFKNIYIFDRNIFELANHFYPKFVIDYVLKWLADTQRSLFNYNEGIYFIHFLIDILKATNEKVDLSCVSLCEEYRNIIFDFDFSKLAKEDMERLVRSKLFNDIINNHCRWFFEVYAENQWDNFQYLPFEKRVVELFDYIEWDLAMITKMDQKYCDLINSVVGRTNKKSLQNGERNRDNYETIIKSNEQKIRKCLKKSQEDILKFKGINLVIGKEE